MDDVYWLPDSEMTVSKRKVNGFNNHPKPPEDHGKYIYEEVHKTLIESCKYREKKNVRAPPILRVKIKGRAENNIRLSSRDTSTRKCHWCPSQRLRRKRRGPYRVPP